MTTAYTTLLGLALPVTGELTGTWGDTVNDYITTYLDGAVAGTQIISGSLTAVTLSKTTGASLSQAGTGATGSSQYQIIRCTGNPASLLTITVPAADKTYVVINATSTSQSVKIVGAGPTTGVTILSGKTSLVTWNGSDFVEITPATATTATTATNLASGSAGTIPYQSASGTTAMLAAGTSGNVLTCNGAAAPSWQPAGASLTGITGATNTALGVSALTALTTGTNNTATGVSALSSNTTGVQNSAFGRDALTLNTTGGYNSVFGYRPLASNTTGSYNIAFGKEALLRNTTGAANLAIGSSVLSFNTTANYNSAVGNSALFNNDTGSYNSAFGNAALFYNTTANYNSAFGNEALYSNTTAGSNSAFGASALRLNTTGGANSAFGFNALGTSTTGDYNSAFGQSALLYNTGSQNSALGFNSLNYNAGSNNSALGVDALSTNGTGSNNVAVGQTSLYSNSTGNQNVAVGQHALYSNTTGSQNVGIGASCASSSTTVSNEVNIYNGTVTARFQGSASSWSFVSDIRDKTNIIDLELGLNFINKLQPRKFEWDLRHTDVDKGKAASGFIAQEVLSVLEQEDALFTGLVDTNDSEKYMLAQTNLIPILVNAIKELSAELTALKLKVGN